MSAVQMTVGEVLALPASVRLETAGRAFGMGRTKSFELARRGEFPCRVIRVGPKYRVPRSAILAALDIEDVPRADAAATQPPQLQAVG